MAQKTTEETSEIEELQEAISNKNFKKFINIFDNYKNQTHLKSDVRNYRCHSKKDGENTESNNTILHHAAVNLDDEDENNGIIEKIVKLSPDLLACGKVSETHKGQTPLHILIVRKQKVTLRRIKDLLLSGELEMGDTVRNNIANPKVEGKWFRKTIMEGELPHIVAALTLDIEIAEIVIEMTQMNIKAKNSKGNTVYHCLVEHAARNPNDIQEVIAMWNFLVRYANKKPDLIEEALDKKTLRETNNDHLRPLQLAAKRGVAALFDIILKLEKIQNNDDGLFDSDLYDICVIDTVAHFKVQTENKKEHEEKENAKRNQVGPSDSIPTSSLKTENKEDQVGKAVTTEKFKWSQSVLEMVCNRKVARNKDSVFQIIRQPAVKMLIKLKWKACRWVVRIWALIHLCLMVWFSAYAIVWSVVAFPSNSISPAITDYQRTFLFVSSILCFVVDVPYLIITVLLIISRCIRPNPREYIMHDLQYIVLLFLFSFGLLVDSIWHHIYLEHDASFLLISVLSGWWFSIFFFRAWEPISVYVAMIQKVIFGDLGRFGLFILLSLVSFSIAFQVLFQGSGVSIGYNDKETAELLQGFRRTIMANIRLMFGLADIEVLDEARQPAIAYTVYLVFVIMTHLVLLNSLIAMISETCAKVRENDRVFYHIQRLSVILFLEEISYPFWTLRDNRFLPKIPYELRHVTRKNKPNYKSYFISMTDNRIKNENSGDKSVEINQQLKPIAVAPILNIRQPFLEEYIGNDEKTDYKLIWK